MKIEDLSKYSNAEKNVLAEQLWDSVSKEQFEISADVKNELDIRIKNLETGNTELYTWQQVKSHLKHIS
ncbi:addiction module protein [Flavobacterium muglaense]|uniref:Addiction module protein n=1 Tax=Flavobacterium muglaense TaxID=2764716 RepID=A0A923MZF7_9FLAO|nr:addiction module protein [Flavobacterium muglaense]MBC5837922.1 addiction module protein [Flavobacterium muglaense]MBC5844516.1 addiction module protein [Flavobacterium muglaense]